MRDCHFGLPCVYGDLCAFAARNSSSPLLLSLAEYSSFSPVDSLFPLHPLDVSPRVSAVLRGAVQAAGLLSVAPHTHRSLNRLFSVFRDGFVCRSGRLWPRGRLLALLPEAPLDLQRLDLRHVQPHQCYSGHSPSGGIALLLFPSRSQRCDVL